MTAGNVLRYHLQRFKTVGSTNQLAMKAAAAGAAEGTVFVADGQTAGRGRGDHTWHSPPGTGLYLSIIAPPLDDPNKLLCVSLMAGLASASAIERVSGVVPDLRWPNDLMLAGKKVGGVLIEGVAIGSRLSRLVVGIGINVNQRDFPNEIAHLATSLRMEVGRSLDREELLQEVLTRFDNELADLTRGGESSVIRRFEESSSYARGAEVEVSDGAGQTFTGVTAGLDRRGFLSVRTSEGLRTVLSGGVRKVAR